MAGNDTIVCFDSTILNGNILLPVSSGTGTLKSYWVIDSLYGKGFAGVTIQDSSNRKSLVNGLHNGQYKFVWVMDNGMCEPTTDTVEISVIQPTFSAGNDTSLCTVSDFQLNSFIADTGFSISWSILTSSPSGASFSNATIINPLLQNLKDGVYALELNVTTGLCDYSDTVIIDVHASPIVYAGVDSVFCGATTFQLWVDSIQFRRIGVWSVDTTLGNATNVAITNIHSDTSSVSFSGVGIYKLIWNSIHSVCDTVSDTVKIVITKALYAFAGNDTVLCSETSLKLNGNNLDTLETGRWSQISGPSFIAFSNSSIDTSLASNLEPGIYELVWKVENGFCDSVTDTIKITIDSFAVSNAGLDESICKTDSATYTLSATASLLGDTGVWIQYSGSSVSFTDSSNSSTAIEKLVPGTYNFIWSVSHGVCGATTDTMQLIVVQEAISDAGFNDTLCIAGDTSNYILSAVQTVLGDTGIWTQFEAPYANISSLTSPITRVTELVADTFSFVWNVTNGFCDTAKDTLYLEVYPEALSEAGDRDTICVKDTGTYALYASSILSTDTGNWTLLNGAGAIITSVNDSNSGVTGLAVGSYEFVWNVTNGFCDTVKDTMYLEVVLEATAAAGPDRVLCVDYTVGFKLWYLRICMDSK